MRKRRKPTPREAAQRLLDLSVQIEVQLFAKTGAAPLAHHLKRSLARMEASLYALAEVDATNANEIRKHQMHVRMHELLLDDLREIIAKGKEAADYLDQEEARDFASSLGLDGTEEDTTPDTEDYA